MASPAIAIRMIRSPMRQHLISRYHDAYEEVRIALDQQVRKRAVALANEVVDNWENKPKFVASLFVEKNKISLYLEPIGPNAKLWEWTSRGTKAHKIYPGKLMGTGKKRSRLMFRKNYTPKTTATGPTYGGPGTKSGPWVSAKMVKHPGTKARKFEEWIGKQIKSDFKREIEQAFRRGMRKAG